MERKDTKVVKIGDRIIGGKNPILIQSMTNTKTEDVKATVEQINRLAAAGCDIIRCAVPTMEAAEALTEIKKQIAIPLVADIHFDYRLAIAALIIFIGSRIAIYISHFLKKTFDRMGMDLSLSKFLISLANAITYAIVIFMALEKIGVTNINPALPARHYDMQERKLIEIAKCMRREKPPLHLRRIVLYLAPSTAMGA